MAAGFGDAVGVAFDGVEDLPVHRVAVLSFEEPVGDFGDGGAAQLVGVPGTLGWFTSGNSSLVRSWAFWHER